MQDETSDEDEARAEVMRVRALPRSEERRMAMKKAQSHLTAVLSRSALPAGARRTINAR